MRPGGSPREMSEKSQRSSAGWRLLLQVSGLFFLMFFLSGLISLLLTFLGLPRLDRWVTGTGMYQLLFIPVLYRLDGDIFSKEHWHFPGRAWIGIGTAILLQLSIERIVAKPAGYTNYGLIFALIFAPVIEVFVQGTLLRLLKQQAGFVGAVVIASILIALCHASFWIAFWQSVLISLVFLKTGESIPAAVATHFAMNLVAAMVALDAF